MYFLKQSAAVDIVIGPFVDDTDGKTPETALTISQSDCQLTKNAGAVAQKNDATAASHLGGGHYKVPLNTTDTNTLGRMRLYINESGALPVWMDFMVMPANVWDSLFSTDLLQVDLTQIAGAAVSTSTAQLGVNAVQAGGTAWGSGAITAAAIATGAIDADAIADNAIDAGAIATGAITAAKFAAGAIDAAAIAANAIDASALAADAVAEIADAVWDEDMEGHTTAGTTGELLELSSAEVWDALLADHEIAGSAGEALAASGGGLTAAAIADAVWDEDATDHSLPSSTGLWLIYAKQGTYLYSSATAAENLKKAVDGTGLSMPLVTIGVVGSVTNPVDANLINLDEDSSAFDALLALAEAVVHGTVVAGTNTTTVVSTALPSAVSGFYVGKTFIARTGANAKQGGKLVTAYDGATKRLTIETLTAAMSADDTFILVG